MVALVNQNCLSSLTSFYSRNILTILAYVFPFVESLRVYRPRYRSNLSFAVKVAEARPGKHRWQGFSARKLWNAIQKVAVRWFAIGKRSDSRQEWEYRVREIRAGASNFTRPVYIAGQKFQLLGRCSNYQRERRRMNPISCKDRTIIIVPCQSVVHIL